MRTKNVENNEGGINTGFSVIDQPWLIDIDDCEAPIKAMVDSI